MDRVGTADTTWRLEEWVDGRIAQLRAQAKSERDEKVKDGGGQKVGHPGRIRRSPVHSSRTS